MSKEKPSKPVEAPQDKAEDKTHSDDQSSAKGNLPLDQVFLRNDVFPDATQLIAFQPPTVKDVLQTGLVVPDTNVLLLLYKAESKGIEDISRVFKQLAIEQRLRMMAQVAREFVARRGEHLLAVLQVFDQAQSKSGERIVPRYPFLEKDEAYSACHKEFESIAESWKLIGKHLGTVRRNISSYSWNDPVSNLCRECFPPSVCVDPTSEAAFDRSQAYQEIIRRARLKIPPGYKDASKEDGGIGDYLIWLGLLQVGRSEKRSVIFLSGDEKSDWMCRTGKQGIFPRYELVDEFRRASQGHTFHMMQLSAFLDLYGLDDAVVKNVEQLEESSTLHPRLKHEAKLLEQLMHHLRKSPRSFDWLRSRGLDLSDEDFRKIITSYGDIFVGVRIIKRDSSGDRVIPGKLGISLR